MKLVREHINEKFSEDSDPIRDMGIGTMTLIKKWLKEHNISDYIINEDLTIDVMNFVHLRLRGNLPEYIQFGKIIGGYFSISDCGVTSLRGCPESIDCGDTSFHGDFNCENNNLTSLKYAPKKVTGHFICYDNKKQFSREDVEKVCKVGLEIQNINR